MHRSDGNLKKIRRTPRILRKNLISPETRVHDEHFAAASMDLSLLVFYAIVFEIHAKNSRRTCSKTEIKMK